MERATDETTNGLPQPLRFEWDPAKAAANLKKHGVSFQEAATVFDDPYAALQIDERYGGDELREWIIGYSSRNRILLVVFVERKQNLIRIITARKPTPQERAIYE